MARILVAEDQSAVREFVHRALVLRGHEVSVAEDGAQALEALQVAPFDLLLTDIVMPVMDGIALALKVARDWPRVRILLMTGYAAERQRAHNLRFLVHEVVSKPFTMEQICHAVDLTLAAPLPPPGH